MRSVFPEEVRCPECGSILRKTRKGKSYYECRNPRCSVIEVRRHKRKGFLEFEVIRDPILLKKVMESGENL